MSTALSRTATGDTSKLAQRIHTPPCVLDPLKLLWPEGVAMDPCGSPDGLVEADTVLCDDDGQCGLSVDWPDRTFVNPPYGPLKKWMGHGVGFDEQVWLVPVRSNRPYWREFRRNCDAMVWMNPIAFVGYAWKYPPPLCLLYRGRDPALFLCAYRHLGDGETL